MLDPDNLVGSMKLVIDALRVAHIIKDDDSDHIELDVKQEKVKHLKDQRVEIEVKEL
jgi:Holliday junction resolvase RusA-like endonuclease